MKMIHLKWLAAPLALAMGTLIGLTAEPTLKVGDPAPKLQTGKWVQGEPVKEFKKSTTYIVEFWATWCGPCRVSIPHLNEIQTRFKDKGLVVIGQDCFERDDALVAPFVKKMGDQMTYRVALDDKSGEGKGKMAETWMEAAGQHGIPTAFLVNPNGVIAWIGHPMTLKDKTISEVIEGTFDLEKAAQEQREQVRMRSAWGEVSKAMEKADWKAAGTKLDELEKSLPDAARGQAQAVRFRILLAQKDYPAAYKVAAAVSEAEEDNAMLQNDLAWQIATDGKIEQRDLALAETIATRADKAAKGKDPAILDTLARVLFMQGKKERAIAAQEKAVKLAEGTMKTSLKKTLESYKKGELPKAD